MLSPLPRPSPSTPTVGRTSTDNNSENHICHWFWGSGMLPGGFPIPTCAERPRGNLGRPNAGPKIARRSLNITPWIRASPSHLGNKSGNFCFSGQTTPGWSSENSSCINRSVVVIYIYSSRSRFEVVWSDSKFEGDFNFIVLCCVVGRN